MERNGRKIIKHLSQDIYIKLIEQVKNKSEKLPEIN